MKTSKKFKTFSLLLVALSIFSINIFIGTQPISQVQGETLEEELERLRNEIEENENEKKELQKELDENQYRIDGYSSEVSKLNGEINLLQKDIDKLNLEIKELEVNIKILNREIEEKQQEIERNEATIADLETESNVRITDNYKSFRVNGNGQVKGTNVFTNAGDMNDYFRDSQYVAIIQEDTNQILHEVAILKDQLEQKKQDLAENLEEVEKEKETIEIKKADLDKRQTEIEVKRNAYYADLNVLYDEANARENAIAAISKEEAETRKRASEVEQAIFNSFNPPNSGTYVVSGTPIGYQGCTGLCTGAHLHFSVKNNGYYQDACSYLKSGGPVGGCGWGNQLDWPIRGGGIYYTSAFGNRCFNWGGSLYCDFHTGTDLAGPANSVIYAAHDGYLYYGTDPYGANYAIVCKQAGCGSGIVTGYWHLQ
jgi:peptidoglycan hydrolase CwlO-like protein